MAGDIIGFTNERRRKEGKGENHLAPGTAEEDLQFFAQKVSTHFILLIIMYPLECYSKFNSIQVLL